MREGVIFTKTGIFVRRWNYERRRVHDQLERDGKYVIVDESSGRIVFEAATEEDAELFFCDCQPAANLLLVLKEDIEIEHGVTLRQLRNAIENLEGFATVSKAFLPLYSCQEQPHEKTPNVSVEALVIAREGVIVDGKLIFTPKGSRDISSRAWDLPLALDESVTISNQETVLFRGTFRFSLLDVLLALFGSRSKDPDPYILTREGLLTSGGTIENPLHHLLDYCRVGENFRLGDLFHFVQHNRVLKNLISRYSLCRDINAFHAQAVEPSKPTELVSLQIARINDGHDGSLAIYCTFEGIGPPYAIGPSQVDDNNVPAPATVSEYGIGWTSMDALANLPILLDEQVMVCESNDHGRTAFQCRLPFALLEILDAVYWEISFYGGPDQIQEMKDMSERVGRRIEDGTEKTIPLEDVLKNWPRTRNAKKGPTHRSDAEEKRGT
jgi:hypothetical protein